MVASLDVEVVNGTTTEAATAPGAEFPGGERASASRKTDRSPIFDSMRPDRKSVTYTVTLDPPPAPKVAAAGPPWALNWISLSNLVPVGGLVDYSCVDG